MNVDFSLSLFFVGGASPFTRDDGVFCTVSIDRPLQFLLCWLLWGLAKVLQPKVRPHCALIHPLYSIVHFVEVERQHQPHISQYVLYISQYHDSTQGRSNGSSR